MDKSIKIDILNSKAISLLKDLESLGLIKLHEEEKHEKGAAYWAKYKGAMGKRSMEEVDKQLKELREEWNR